jgi:hypothetical protein
LVYVDDIVFGCTNESSVQWFANSMQTEFEISMIRELSYFLGLQVKQSSAGIFISQEKYLKQMLKKFQMEDSSTVSTPMVVGCKLSKDDISPDVDISLNDRQSSIHHNIPSLYNASCWNGRSFSVCS